MTKTKCTGCKLFSLCLGDGVAFLHSGIVSKCFYCHCYMVGHTPHRFYAQDCEDMLREEQSNNHDDKKKATFWESCGDPDCDRRAKQDRETMVSPEWFKTITKWTEDI